MGASLGLSIRKISRMDHKKKSKSECSCSDPESFVNSDNLFFFVDEGPVDRRVISE